MADQYRIPVQQSASAPLNRHLSRAISYVVQRMPNGWKLAVIGQPGNPSRLANHIHALMNRAPTEDFPVMPCSGPLSGFRMRIKWRTRRSYLYGIYEPPVVKAIENAVAPGMVAVDIGANGGYYTLLLSKLVGDSGRVVAYEPLRENFKFLEENVLLNRRENVRAECAAVSDRSGSLELELPDPNSALWAGPAPENAGRGVVRVPAVTIDEAFVDSTALHFLKIDVEGAEGAVLAGAMATIQRFHPAMVVELHDYEKYGTGHPVIAQLKSLGYQVHSLDDGMYCAHVLATWTPAPLQP